MRRFGPQRGHRGSEQADVAFANVSHESPDNIITEKDASRVGVYSFALLMFAAGFAAVFVLSSPWLSVFTVLGSAAAGLLLASTLRVAAQWEHVALLRFGRFRKIAGPGVYVVVPFVDSVAMHIDRRTITTAFYAEQALTSDLVSVDVDAILFWMVYDSEKACLEVANFPQAVRRAAQTAVRDAIGQVTLAELSVRRRKLDHELQEFMAEKCEEWGISVISVEIRNIKIPKELQDSLAREAQAERERDARVLLADVEREISEMYVEAARVYNEEPGAMQLRAMNLSYESARDGKGVLLAPSSLADGFVDLGKDMAK